MGEWFTGERYGRNIIGDMRNWVEGWLDWNIVLDENGGPNHVGNYCNAPVIADTAAGEVYFNSSYWYIGHFSRFVPPGSLRIASNDAGAAGEAGTADPSEGLHHIAFLTPAGELVIVIMNESERDRRVALCWASNAAAASCEIPAHSIVTLKGDVQALL